jgi:hypothetical protein
VGKKHLAVIINGEICYCGINFPYMSLVLSRESAYPIVIGSHGGNNLRYFRSIRVSQLAETLKNKVKQGELTMITKQSNSIIPIIHRLVTDEYGENYWFNGCAKYVMEALGEKDYDYWFFAGISGDCFTQVYGQDLTRWYQCLSHACFDERLVKRVFDACGYDYTFVSPQSFSANREKYVKKVVEHIDRGLPVIVKGFNVLWSDRIWLVEEVSCVVGYENGGILCFTCRRILLPQPPFRLTSLLRLSLLKKKSRRRHLRTFTARRSRTSLFSM